MRFSKPSLTIAEQAELLEARGMGGGLHQIERRLNQVNYYRLAAYWHTFRDGGGDEFLPGTNIDTVWDRYLFDRRLRLLTMDAVERFEVTVRTRLAHELACEHGAFGCYTGSVLFRDKPDHRAQFLGQIYGELARNRDVFITHFRDKYGDEHDAPPIWVVVEILSFGKVVKLYNGSPAAVQRRVAEAFGVPEIVLESWLRTLNWIRNICAHHGRLWNRAMVVKPKIPRRKLHPDWYEPIKVEQGGVFTPLTILAYVLGQIAPRTSWGRRLSDLLDAHPEIPRQQMGFPDDWKMSPIWVRMLVGTGNGRTVTL